MVPWLKAFGWKVVLNENIKRLQVQSQPQVNDKQYLLSLNTRSWLRKLVQSIPVD